ncbi:tRNA threonylcarbamoyladenosine biosynthesis protein TsaE [Albidovulum inexpectatum]|uniref:tRNA threonylcarbamoyladenosine biosynthesis protein TsaE n=2 Tax=Albidovulum inexpectatum TaxID=196587 RepID=A0A2S5JMC2_9RHOB|nr:tRNA threonylcarbamoyladenosine biosynthesis protein TsaE [Albidovulum inexpectatum]
MPKDDPSGDNASDLSLTLRLADAEATADLARRIAPHLRAGDTILLSGPIGAGKSHFCRSLIQARLAELGRVEDVPSPTYTIVQVYDAGEVEIWHADLYRLTGPDEIVELGLEEAFEAAICLVEWPDRLEDLAPENALWLDLAPSQDNDSRKASLRATDRRWAPILRQLAQPGPMA